MNYAKKSNDKDFAIFEKFNADAFVIALKSFVN